MKQYKDTNITLPYDQFFKPPQEINPINVQHRITQYDYNQFCQRLQFAMKDNKNARSLTTAIIIIIAIVLTFPVIGLLLQDASLAKTIVLFFYIVIILLIKNRMAMNSNLEEFISRENTQYWNSRGLRWLVVGTSGTKHQYLRLQISSDIQSHICYRDPTIRSSNKTLSHSMQSSHGCYPVQPEQESSNSRL